MAWYNFWREQENRNLEDPSSPVSASDFMKVMGWEDLSSPIGITITADNALGVPAIFAAVNFLASTIAALPVQVQKKTDGRWEAAETPSSHILKLAANDETTAFDWRKNLMEGALTAGRGLSYIEKKRNGQLANLWGMDPYATEIKRAANRTTYKIGDNIYSASEIIDIPFMTRSDGFTTRSPLTTNRETIALAIAATRYGSKIFERGGLPLAVMEGPVQSGAGAARASDDLANTMAKMNNEGKTVMVIPIGHTLKTLGFDPEKMQMVDLKRLLIEEIARIYSLPPVFLQDLTRGTFSNTEQQDLHLVKHTLNRWVTQFEQQLTLKLFGRNPAMRVKMNVDGLLRGDFRTRMEAHAKAIQNGIRTMNEVREIEDEPPMEGGEGLFIQGATVPVKHQLEAPKETTPPTPPEPEEGDEDE